MNRYFWLVLGASVACFGASAACSARPILELGGSCDLTTDCAAPYVCRLGACRQECREVRDCAPGLLCVQDSEGFGVCQKPEERECARDSECADGLECRFGTCTNGCATNRDCLNGLVCAEESPMVLACMDPTMTECVLNSDCDEPLVCARDQRCREECREDRDCRDGNVCGLEGVFLACISPSMDGGLDGGLDGGGDSATDGGVDADAGLDAAADSGADAAAAIAPPSVPVAALSSGHGCSLGAPGLRCWGENSFGQVGVGATSVFQAPIGIAFPGGAIPRWYALGRTHSCAVTDEVYCWGSNTSMQLGLESTSPTQPMDPVVIPGVIPGDIVGVAAGGDHTCAWTRTSIHCWGENARGQLGSGVGASTWAPNTLTVGGDVIDMALGNAHTCALRADGVVFCWGSNREMQLGDGTTDDHSRPTQSLVTGAASLASGDLYSCALHTDGRVTCWGYNEHGQVGAGVADGFGMSRGPTAVVGVGTATGVTAGASHTCVLEATGVPKCFGYNVSAQCGAPAVSEAPTPRTPAFSGGAASVWAAGDSTCVELAAGGGIECIGRNSGGVFGRNDGATATPVSVTW